MSEHCPTCGQPMPRPQPMNATALLHLLTHGTPHREVFKARDCKWYVTYGGGPVREDAVKALVQAGKIVSVYSNCPTDAYHVGRTWDYERTITERKRTGTKANYYVGDP